MNASIGFISPVQAERPYTVSEINDGVARIIEQGNTLVWVEGELSNVKMASSGHCYMRLKDDYSQVPAVIWKQTAKSIEFAPLDGMQVIAIASVRVYQKGGYYQLDIHRMQPAGVGALYAAFCALKDKLEREGLFDGARKKPLPDTISTLGVITSKHGAALFDIVKVVRSRSPRIDIVVIDVPVQGDAAPKKIAQAIADMNRYKKVDCMIVGRGGGSAEDLWAFNDECVARAIYASSIPVISAVGHEIDFTIADFVADLRAPTPSAAAEIATADDRESRRYFVTLCQRAHRAFFRYYTDAKMSFDNITTQSCWQIPVRIMRNAREDLDTIRMRQERSATLFVKKTRQHVNDIAARLNSLSPLAVMSRGFSVTFDKNGDTVKTATQLSAHDPITIYFEKGTANATVVGVHENDKTKGNLWHEAK
jgi:exodeoxyribonuclease VII large subunit